MTDTALNALRRAQFDVSDIIRRAQGEVVGAFGLDPQESSHQIIMSRAHWRLRDYGGTHRSRTLLIIAAPIKRPYIWDLAHSISAIRFCLHQGLHVQLLEWMPASPKAGNNGLDEYVLAISRSRGGGYERGSRRKAHPNRSFARRHTCGDIRSLLAREHQWPCTFRCATLLSTVRESISRRSGNAGSKRDFRCGAISRFTLVTRKRVGISRYIHLVTPDGRGDEYC